MSPEFLNRLDYKIVFRPLEKKIMAKILKHKIKEFLDTRKQKSEISHDMLPNFSDSKIKEIIEKIYDPQFGARPIERYIFDEIEPMLINKIL